MHGIADHRLIEVANLDLHFAFRIGDRPEIAGWQSPQIQIAGP